MSGVEYEDSIIKLYIENDMLFGEFKTQSMDLEIAVHSTETKDKIRKGKNYPTLADCSALKKCTKESREFLSSEKAIKGANAIAIVVNSPVGAIMSNFFIQLNKPPLPTKLFRDKKTATKWLQQFKEK